MSDETPLYRATVDHDLVAVESLVQVDSSQVNARDELLSTPLHAAAFDGQRSICEVLIRYGADVNSQNVNGDTPLHEAARQGCSEVVNLLLEHGAEIDAKNGRGWTPLYFSTSGTAKCRAVADLLLKHGARLDLNSAIRLGRYDHVKKTLRGRDRPIQYALFPEELILDVVSNMSRRDEAATVISDLLGHGANVNGVNYANESALIVVCADSEMPIEVIQILLDKHADPTIKRKSDGASAFRVAQFGNNDRAVQVLRDHGIEE